KFDDMRLEEAQNVAQYFSRIKDVVNAIRGATGKIDDDTILRKLLRTLLPIYAIRFSVIQEL
ncbi:retrotransposon gag domain-containing protein, partial [Vibrio cholerae]|uniref:retrotransposon gag domain-containing protein n=1 Tax=Vibrio cholerae TaxID=666 RepID=UPI001F2DA0A2